MEFFTWALEIKHFLSRCTDWQSLMVGLPSQIAKFMGPTWGPPGSCWPKMGPMLVPWTVLSGSSPQCDSREIAWLEQYQIPVYAYHLMTQMVSSNSGYISMSWRHYHIVKLWTGKYITHNHTKPHHSRIKLETKCKFNNGIVLNGSIDSLYICLNAVRLQPLCKYFLSYKMNVMPGRMPFLFTNVYPYLSWSQFPNSFIKQTCEHFAIFLSNLHFSVNNLMLTNQL